jgi:glycosyltransferase involved in cell wall biosynthesis
MPSDLKTELQIGHLLVMYVGNLETYQGVDLLLESFALVLWKTTQASLVIVGGEPVDIQKYQRNAEQLNIHSQVHFLGQKPVRDLGLYLSQADILVSPRIKGKNTPMKLYSYLDSGKPLVATNLLTHTQLLDPRLAILTEPTPEGFSQGLLQLIQDESLRLRLGTAGKQFVEQKHTYTAFREKLTELYDWLQGEVVPGAVVSVLRDSA